VPTGSPPQLTPHPIKALEEVKKGLNGFIALWNRMANNNQSGKFKRKNAQVNDYWKFVRIALDVLLQMQESLLDRF